MCREDFPRANAYQIAETLAEGWREIVEPTTEAEGPRPPASVRVAVHPGAGSTTPTTRRGRRSAEAASSAAPPAIEQGGSAPAGSGDTTSENG